VGEVVSHLSRLETAIELAASASLEAEGALEVVSQPNALAIVSVPVEL
jgi:hypothetical protein